MKILHINSNYHRSTIYKNMKEGFQKYLNDTGKTYFSTYSEHNFISEKNLDIDINKSPFYKFLPFIRNKKIVESILELYELKKFDSIIAYSLFSNGTIAYRLNKLLAIPFYVIVQNTDVNLHFKKIPFSVRKGNKIFERATKIVFISDSYKSEVINSFAQNKKLIEEKSIVIPFGIDDFWRKNINENQKSLNKELRLLYVGKLNKNKNIDMLKKVIDSLNRDGTKARLSIVGEIEDKKIFEIVNNSQNITWKPYTENREQLLELYRSHDIFIMPSFKESFGLVYGEAMSQGLPVIYTRGQGFDKQFPDGDIGFSVDPKNANEIIEKINLVVRDYDSISRRCKIEVTKFYWENIIKQYEVSCLNEVLQSKYYERSKIL